MEEQKKKSEVLVGIDDGYRETKVVFRQNGRLAEVKCPSSVRVGAIGLSSLDGKSFGYTTTVDGKEVTYTVGHFHDAVETRFPDFPVSPIVRVLVNHGLQMAGLGGSDVVVATGLPPGDAYLPSGERNKDLIERKKENLLVPVRMRDGGEMPHIVRGEVYVQGIGALIDHLSSSRRSKLSAPVGVVDVGGRTVDVAVILPDGEGMSVDMRRSGSENIGVIDAMDALSNLVRSHFRLDEKIPLGILEKSLDSGSITLFGQKRDIQNLVRDAKNEIMERLRPFITAKLGRGQDLEMILFTGGGAMVLPTLLSSYSHAVRGESPQFANARGFLLYLEMMSKHEGV